MSTHEDRPVLHGRQGARNKATGTDAWLGVERRAPAVEAHQEGLELRAAAGGAKSPGTLVGYAAVFGTDSDPIGGAFVERVQRGAFARALREQQDVRALVAHDMAQVLGRTTSGTLRLAEDERGLRMELDLPDTQAGRDMAESVRRRDVRQMSFAFKVKRPHGERWEVRAAGGGMDRRVLTDVDLYDVSPLAFAAYPDTELALRSHAAFLEHSGSEPKAERAVPDVPLERGVDLLPGESRTCLASHLGPYLMHQETLQALVLEAQRGELRAAPPGANKGPAYTVKDGVALVELRGPMARESKMPSSSTRALRGVMRQAVGDPTVRGILLRVDSPGGQALGTSELADAVAEAARSKPVHAFVDGMAASAAYFVASQARRITMGPLSEVGSIGTVAVLHDVSEMLRRDGIRVHVVATGPDKGLGYDGSVPERLLEQVRERVTELQQAFTDAVSRGRSLTGERLAAVSTGRVFSGRKAVELGLADAIGTEEDAEAELRKALEVPVRQAAHALPEPQLEDALSAHQAAQRKAELDL